MLGLSDQAKRAGLPPEYCILTSKDTHMTTRNFKLASYIFCAPALFIGAPALAEEKDSEAVAPPAIYTDLVACKSIADADQRLACYDARVTALETAQASNEVIIADREQVREARRSVFGLTLPRIKLFDGNSEKGDNVDEIEATITSVSKSRNGKWFFKLEDGALWQQTEARPSKTPPKEGDTVVIKRGALGSFLAKLNGGRSFKVIRIVN